MTDLDFDTTAIRGDAAGVAAPPISGAQTHVIPPCALTAAQNAASALNGNAEKLLRAQKELSAFRDQISAAMRRAADLYDGADEHAARALSSTMDSGGSTALLGEMMLGLGPPSVSTTDKGFLEGLFGVDPPVAPAAPADEGYRDVPSTQEAMSAPDTGGSLMAAVTAWMANAETLRAAAAAIPAQPSHWDNPAAEQAYARIGELRGKMVRVADGWDELAGQGFAFHNAHVALKTGHDQVFADYTALLADWNTAAAAGDGPAMAAIQTDIKQAVAQSEEIRRQYGRASQLPPGPKPPKPGPLSGSPSSGGMTGSGGGPSWGDQSPMPLGDGTPSATWASGGRRAGGTAAPDAVSPQRGAGSQNSPQGAGQDPAQSAAQNPAQGPAQSAPQTPEGKPPGGGTPSGGTPSGGSPPGGVPGGGQPGTGKSEATPFSPSVHPAAAGGHPAGGGGAGRGLGGAGHGGGDGGGHCGAGGVTPLSPPVTAEGVAPAPRGAGAGPGAAVSGRAPVASSAGGVGGPMMGHGAGHTQGREKRRSPALTPDESLYSEDRPWTEGVVGQRRRREIPGTQEIARDKELGDDT